MNKLPDFELPLVYISQSQDGHFGGHVVDRKLYVRRETSVALTLFPEFLDQYSKDNITRSPTTRVKHIEGQTIVWLHQPLHNGEKQLIIEGTISPETKERLTLNDIIKPSYGFAPKLLIQQIRYCEGTEHISSKNVEINFEWVEGFPKKILATTVAIWEHNVKNFHVIRMWISWSHNIYTPFITIVVCGNASHVDIKGTPRPPNSYASVYNCEGSWTSCRRLEDPVSLTQLIEAGPAPSPCYSDSHVFSGI